MKVNRIIEKGRKGIGLSKGFASVDKLMEDLNNNMSKTKRIALTAVGIALYVVVSMLLKIPMIGHISFDLGYIVLAFYCMMFGPLSAALVGCCGSFLVSLIASGWIAIGWPLGNLLIGAVCAMVYKPDKPIRNIGITILMVFIGVLGIKTAIECPLYGIPILVKIPKNLVAAIADSITMCIGALFAGKCYDRLIDNI